MKKKLTEIFGMGDESDGIPHKLPPGGLPVKKPTMPFDFDGGTKRMSRSMDNDVTGRIMKGRTSPLGSPQDDEPLPDLPLEAFGMGAGDIKNQLSSAKDTYAAISKAIKMAGTGRDPVEVASALHDALYGEGSKPQPIKGGSEMGSSSSSMTSKAVGGLKLQ